MVADFVLTVARAVRAAVHATLRAAQIVQSDAPSALMASDQLKYFMWAYQPYFRFSMERRAREVLSALGVQIPLKALLVGVRLPEVEAGHPVCLEPEDGHWPISTFETCHERTEAIERDHPDNSIFYGDEPRMRDKPENTRRKSVLQAVSEASERYDAAHGTTTHWGWPTKLGRYHVVAGLQLSTSDLAAYPALPERIRYNDWTSTTGIVEAVILGLVAEASEALEGKEPGRFFDTFSADAEGLLRQAAQRVGRALTLFVEDVQMQDVFNELNAISSLRYEGGATSGEIVFAPPGSPALDQRLTFPEPVPLSSPRLARKFVEMSGDDLVCICNGHAGLSGLGTVLVSNRPVFRVAFTGHYRWDLYYDSVLLMRCEFGVPKVPTLRLSEARFASNARRVLAGLSEAECGALWAAVSAAIKQKHGTMLVVSRQAEAEAKRLRRQSMPVQPVSLTRELVERVSRIDGAILVDTECRCHAVGVILDGMATESGDPSRGARYNSAVRYASSAQAPTLCLVVSEDGDVDMVPTLRPQVSKSEIQANVDRMGTLTRDNYHEVRNWLDAHRFYLTAAQCEFLNTQLARINAEPLRPRAVTITMAAFSPHPEMNASYYAVDEDAQP